MTSVSLLFAIAVFPLIPIVLHFRKCRRISTPHLLFLSLAEEKEDVPLTVQKKKKTLWVRIDRQIL